MCIVYTASPSKTLMMSGGVVRESFGPGGLMPRAAYVRFPYNVVAMAGIQDVRATMPTKMYGFPSIQQALRLADKQSDS